jgi:hypothetical protein
MIFQTRGTSLSWDCPFNSRKSKQFNLVSKALENMILYLKTEIVLLLLLDNWQLVRGPPIPRNYRMRAAKNAGQNQLIFCAHRQDGLSLYVHRQNALMLSAVCLTIF